MAYHTIATACRCLGPNNKHKDIVVHAHSVHAYFTAHTQTYTTCSYANISTHTCNKFMSTQNWQRTIKRQKEPRVYRHWWFATYSSNATMYSCPIGCIKQQSVCVLYLAFTAYSVQYTRIRPYYFLNPFRFGLVRVQGINEPCVFNSVYAFNGVFFLVFSDWN